MASTKHEIIAEFLSDSEFISEACGEVKNFGDYSLKGGLSAAPIHFGLYSPLTFNAVNRCECGLTTTVGVRCPKCKVKVVTAEEFNRGKAYYNKRIPTSFCISLKKCCQTLQEKGINILGNIKQTNTSNEVAVKQIWSLNFSIMLESEYKIGNKIFDSLTKEKPDNSERVFPLKKSGKKYVLVLSSITDKTPLENIGCFGLLNLAEYSNESGSLSFIKNFVNYVFPIISPALRPVSFVVQNGKTVLGLPFLHSLYKGLITVDGNMDRLLKLHKKSAIDQATLCAAFNIMCDRIMFNGEYFASSKKSVLRNLSGTRLGKSARGNIIANASLKLNEIAVPWAVAYYALQAEIIQKIIDDHSNSNVQLNAEVLYKNRDPIAYRAMEDIVQEGCVLLQRSPVLHRFGIQAFNIVFTDNPVIELHPLLADAYNADYDGDQMMLIFILEAAKARKIMRIMSPGQGIWNYDRTDSPVYVPSHEALFGLNQASKIMVVKEPKYVPSLKELKELVDSNEIDIDEEVIIRGKHTSYGVATIEKLIGCDLFHLIGEGETINITNIAKLVTKIGAYEDRLDRVKELNDLGNYFATYIGTSPNPLTDVYPKFKDEVEAIYNSDLDSERKLVELNSFISRKVVESFNGIKDSNFDEVYSGSSRIKLDVFKQIYSPIVSLTSDGDVKIGSSYLLDGLTESDMIRQARDNREVLVVKKQGVPISGYNTRQFSNLMRQVMYSPKPSPDKIGIKVPKDNFTVKDRSVISIDGDYAYIKSIAAREKFDSKIYSDEIRRRFIETATGEVVESKSIGVNFATAQNEFITQSVLGLKYGADLETIENEYVVALFDGKIKEISDWLVVTEDSTGKEWRYPLTKASALTGISKNIGNSFKKGDKLITSNKRVHIRNQISPISALLGTRVAGEKDRTQEKTIGYAFEDTSVKYTDKYMIVGKLRIAINQNLIYKYPDGYDVKYGDRVSSGVLDLARVLQQYPQSEVFYIFYKEFIDILSARSEKKVFLEMEMVEVLMASMLNSAHKTVKGASDEKVHILDRVYDGSTVSGFTTSVLNTPIVDNNKLKYPDSIISRFLMGTTNN